MTEDLTARVTALTATIEQRLAEDEAAAKAAASVAGQEWEFDIAVSHVRAPSGTVLADTMNAYNDEEMGPFIARNDPARVLRRVAATRSLVAAILTEEHHTERCGLYSGRCTCGRDTRVVRLLTIIASEWEEQ